MTDNSRVVSNPLALAVLVLLYERPMHPYEMATTMRERGKEKSIRLNYGSLYTIIEQLLREKFIAVKEVLKEGKRPEKTIYDLTPAGEAELLDWMRELVSSPVKEYPQFEAALSLLACASSGRGFGIAADSHRLAPKNDGKSRRKRTGFAKKWASPRLFLPRTRILQGRHAGRI